MPKVDFRQFQGLEAQNDDSLAKSHMWRRETEVGMVVAYHLDDRLGIECGRRWLSGISAQSKSENPTPKFPISEKAKPHAKKLHRSFCAS